MGHGVIVLYTSVMAQCRLDGVGEMQMSSESIVFHCDLPRIAV